MIDLHTHVLPGIDDGADSLQEAVEMCRRAADDGIEALCATPHQHHNLWWNGDHEDLRRRREELQAAVGPRPRILAGAEIRVGHDFLDSLFGPEPHRPTPLAGSRWMLVEFSRQAPQPEPEGILHELRVAGWKVVLAHPELLPWLAHDQSRLDGMADLGAKFQLTAMSLTGGFGRNPRRAAEQILDRGQACFLASDCHGAYRRPPGLSEARDLIAEAWGEDLARRLTVDNPQAVIDDEDLP
ncbi:MAG: CpsB/CapC family capsule biosynthesis tyrosine phosphatase [Acidobacteriota bacterium]